MAETINKPLLEVKNLKTYFYTEDGVVKAVDGVDFAVDPGEVLGLVGESGCGKSVTSFSIMRLVGIPGKIVEGEILFEGRDLLKLPESEMVKMRGNRMSMIFQQPQSSLNPVFTVGDQVAEVLQIHENMAKEKSWERAVELLKLVGIPDAGRKAKAYPARNVGRAGAARDDRHGAGAETRAADRRRADHRAGCDHPGPDPGPDARPARQNGHLGDPDHPRPGRDRRNGRPGGGDVRRADCRTGGGE